MSHSQVFNRAVDSYDEAAILQREVGNELLDRLQYIRMEPETILDLGAGTGYLTQKLSEKYNDANVISLDFAEQMLKHSRYKESAQKVCADALKLPIASQSIDFVFSNLMMQWCQDIQSLLKEIKRVLRPEGLFMFTSFGPDTLRELRASWLAVDEETHVNHFIDMHDLGDILVVEKFADPVMDQDQYTLTYRDVPSLIRDLKSIGAAQLTDKSRVTLTGKQRFTEMQTAYEQFRWEDGLLPATYEVIFGHAWRPQLRTEQTVNAQGEVHIPIGNIT